MNLAAFFHAFCKLETLWQAGIQPLSRRHPSISSMDPSSVSQELIHGGTSAVDAQSMDRCSWIKRG
jgi:hypothetical protein